MVTIDKLIKASNNMKLGNHSKEYFQEGQKYYLYSTCICEVNHIKGTVTLDKSYGSQTTTRAVNAYKRALEGEWLTKNYDFIINE